VDADAAERTPGRAGNASARSGNAAVSDGGGNAAERRPRSSRSRSGRDSLKGGAAAVVPLSGDLGVVHICDFTECRLPAEDWYISSKNRRT
jgi:hypothetical protein